MNEMARKVWQEGFAPGLSGDQLAALAEALRADDPRLLQGATTMPPPLLCVQDWPVEGGCVLGFCGAVESGGFKGDPAPALVGQVEEFFARQCFEADERLGGPGACRWFLQWWDDTPRSQALALMLEEVRHELSQRSANAAA